MLLDCDRNHDEKPTHPRAHAIGAAHGFTLVEMLVVIALILVLSSLLLPSLNKAMDAAENASCSNNQRQIGICMAGYIENYRGWFPPQSYNGWNSGTWYGLIMREAGIDFSNGLTDAVTFMKCPADPGYKFWYTYVSYGYNGTYLGFDWLPWGGTYGAGHCLSRIKKPSAIICTADSAKVSQAYSVSFSGNIPSDRHQGGANVLFCDWHLAWVPTPLLTDATTGRQWFGR